VHILDTREASFYFDGLSYMYLSSTKENEIAYLSLWLGLVATKTALFEKMVSVPSVLL